VEYQNFVFFSVETSFSCLDWIVYMPHHSKLNTGSMIGYSAVWVYPLRTHLQGLIKSLHSALSRIELRTSRLTVQRYNHKTKWLMICHVRMCLYTPGYPRTSRESKNSKFKICLDQEFKLLFNSGSPGCPCHQMSYATRPHWLVIRCSNLKI
jgi:hypothetical protein